MSAAFVIAVKDLRQKLRDRSVLLMAVLYTVGLKIPSGTDHIKVGMGSLGAIPVAFVVIGIGLSLGGTTGYAINPARDLGPRIAHFLLPIPGKRDSDWGYAWIPVVGPMVGAAIAYFVYNFGFTEFMVKILAK